MFPNNITSFGATNIVCVQTTGGRGGLISLKTLKNISINLINSIRVLNEKWYLHYASFTGSTYEMNSMIRTALEQMIADNYKIVVRADKHILAKSKDQKFMKFRSLFVIVG